jgi:hypothetical protein
MTGPELVAGAIALTRFQSVEIDSDINSFLVQIEERPKALEVIFVPKAPPLDSKSGGVRVTFGGRNAYGREVHYSLSKETGEITRTTFGR